MPHLASRLARPNCAALCGESSALVIAFTDAWGCPERGTLEALRTELRALGCALLVASDDSLFFFNPRPASPAALDNGAVNALRRAYGDPRRRPGVLTLTVLERDGRERFRWLRKQRGSAYPSLLEALQLARQSIDLPASFRTFSERELLFYSLVGALNLVLSDNVTVAAPAAAQA